MVDNTHKTAKIWAFVNLAGWLGTVTVNVLANLLPINGMTTGEISSHYPNLFTPAGLTFSVWAVIYLLLFGFVLYGITGVFLHKDRVAVKLEKFNIWFVLSCALNCAWLLAWHHEYITLSVIIMLLLLATLMVLYEKVRQAPMPLSAGEYAWIKLPFSIYVGWISVATIANFTAMLVNNHWHRARLSEDFWLCMVLLFAVALTLYMVFRFSDAAYALTVVWALSGITVKLSQTANTHLAGFYVTIAGMAVIIAATAFQSLRQFAKQKRRITHRVPQDTPLGIHH